MNQKTRIAVSFLLGVVLLISASCALLPPNVQEFISGFSQTESTPRVIVVTSTPQISSGDLNTAQTKLKITPCLYNSDCPDAVDLDDMLNAQQQASYEVKLPYDTLLKLSNGWVAIDDKTLEENLAHIKWIFEVDGEDYYQPEYVVKGTVNTIQDSSVENSGAWLGVTIEGFSLNQTVTMVVGYTFSEAINDGWEDFPAGYTSTITYHFLPQPLDFGSPTMK